MRNASKAPDPEFLPLLDQKGHLAAEGRMTCQTCHLPHGRTPSRGLAAVAPAATSRPELDKLRPMLRPYVAPNICSGCHGFEGLRKFLYYHYPEKR